MKVLKTLLLFTVVFCIVVAPASAGYFIAGGSGGYGFGYSGLGIYSPPAPVTSTPTNSGPTTLNTSSCLYNSCSPTTPTNTPTAPTTPTSPATTSSVLTSSFGAPAYSYGGSYGSYTRYAVFGMYNIQGGGSTQTPVLGGGLTPTNVLGDPLANPEPTSVALFGAGLIAFGWARKRHMSRKA